MPGFNMICESNKTRYRETNMDHPCLELAVGCNITALAPVRVREIRSQVVLPPSNYLGACIVRIFLDGILRARISIYGRKQEFSTDRPMLRVRPVYLTGRTLNSSRHI